MVSMLMSPIPTQMMGHNRANFLNFLIIYQRLSLEMHKQMIQSQESHLMEALSNKLHLHSFLRRTSIAKELMLLILHF